MTCERSNAFHTRDTVTATPSSQFEYSRRRPNLCQGRALSLFASYCMFVIRSMRVCNTRICFPRPATMNAKPARRPIQDYQMPWGPGEYCQCPGRHCQGTAGVLQGTAEVLQGTAKVLQGTAKVLPGCYQALPGRCQGTAGVLLCTAKVLSESCRVLPRYCQGPAGYCRGPAGHCQGAAKVLLGSSKVLSRSGRVLPRSCRVLPRSTPTLPIPGASGASCGRLADPDWDIWRATLCNRAGPVGHGVRHGPVKHGVKPVPSVTQSNPAPLVMGRPRRRRSCSAYYSWFAFTYKLHYTLNEIVFHTFYEMCCAYLLMQTQQSCVCMCVAHDPGDERCEKRSTRTAHTHCQTARFGHKNRLPYDEAMRLISHS